jgi:hypothetical protein
LTLARVFYRRPKAVAGVRHLARERGWHVSHSFHWGHMETGFAWTHGDIDLDSYLNLWTAEISRSGAIPRSEWDRYFEWLVATRTATLQDRHDFDESFTQTKRKTATPRPGFTSPVAGPGWTLQSSPARASSRGRSEVPTTVSSSFSAHDPAYSRLSSLTEAERRTRPPLLAEDVRRVTGDNAPRQSSGT